MAVPVSAKRRVGIEHLLEMILLVSEMGELKANPKRRGEGVVIEAKLDKTRGPLATVLVQNGNVKLGEYIVAGATYGRVKAMNNDRGKPVKRADPSMPVEILGLVSVPEAGDAVRAVPDERTARSLSQDETLAAPGSGGSANKAERHARGVI